MKTSINTYSFSKIKDSGGNTIPMTEMIEKAAEIGFDAIEFVGVSVPADVDMTPLEYAKVLRKKCSEKGLSVSAYTVGADFLSDKEVVEKLKSEVDIAEALGTGIMRHDICYSLPEDKTYFDLIPEFVPKVRELAEYAALKGIKTCTENHGYVSQDADRVIALKKAVNSDNFGLLVDFGNFMCADEISVESVAKAIPYAVHIHAKDFLYQSKENAKNPLPGFFPTREGNYLCGCALGDGVVNVCECVKIVKNAGYNGYITLEFEGPFGDPLEEIKKGFERLKTWIL